MQATSLRARTVVVSVGCAVALGSIAAMSIDVPRASYGVKSDEATYIAAALSAAYDLDLAYERRDLERFAALYHAAPEGIFLKRGKSIALTVDRRAPFVHLARHPDANQSRLYYGKAIIYPVLAAPFVRFLGVNGLLVFHVLLLGVVAIAGYLFVEAQSSPWAAATFTAAFVGASVLPVYGAILMPEFFTFSVVFLAYFLWLYKEVRPCTSLRGPWTDIVAAALLGLCTYGKPIPVAATVPPLVLLAWGRRRWAFGFELGLTAVAVTLGLFAATAAVSGEFNYQGGDRKVFYRTFPFDGPDATWDQRGGGVIEEPVPELLDAVFNGDAIRQFGLNVQYFLVGRHFGFIPYFFPGAAAILLWLFSAARRDRWRLLTFGGFVLSVLMLLVALPLTWSGGGGSAGNRYLINVYPLLFFLMPPGVSALHSLLAWSGGALFTAKMLVSPFLAAKSPWLMVETGPLRILPVELAMADALPAILIQPPRTRIPYGPREDRLWLYFLDHNAWPPEPRGMWVSGSARADIIIRRARPLHHLTVEVDSPIATTVSLRMGGTAVTVALTPGQTTTVDVPAHGVRGPRGDLGAYFYLLTARSTSGFVPRLVELQSVDYRNLGAQLRFRPIGAPTLPSNQ